MTWNDHLEQKGRLLVGGVIAICALALAVTARRLPVSPDSYWHLQTGLDWIHKGLSPWIDHFSFTYAGEPITSQPVVFQALLAVLVDAVGLEAGFQLVKFAAFALSFVLIIVFMRRLRSPTIVYLVALPLLTLLLELRATVRPELFSYSFSIVAVMLYHRARGQATLSNILPMALLMLIWTNYHASTLGYILLFGFFIDAAVRQLRENANLRDWSRWLVGGLLVLSVGFLNNGFQHPMIDAFMFAPEWKDYIQEYRSAALYKNVAGIYAFATVAIGTLILALKQQKYGYAVVILVFAFYSLRMVRLVTPAGIIVLCLLISLLSEFDVKNFIDRQRKLVASTIGFGACFVVFTSLFSAVALARDFMRENRTSALVRPESIAAYMKDRGLSGRIFNEYGIGGYLIHALAPDSTVYIDGRTNILYPPEHYERFLRARNSSTILLEEVEKYAIDFAVLQTDRRVYSVMYEAGVFGLDFVDFGYSLFTRDAPRFPVAGKLLGNPACWQEDELKQLESEHTDAVFNLPRNSSLLPNLGFMFSYAQHPDREVFLQEFAAASTGNEIQLRFAAYQALSLGHYEISATLLERIDVWDLKDFLAAAMANLQFGNWHEADSVADSLTKIKWPNISGKDTILLYRILENLRQSGSPQTIPEDYYEQVKEQVKGMGQSTEKTELDFTLLCAT